MQNHTARGILSLCLGVLVFSLQDAIIKQVSGAYPLTEVVGIRSVVGVPILLWLVQREVGWRALMAPQWRWLAVRALILFVSYTAYYMAFPALPLADAVALYFTVPLFVTALAGPFLGEKSGWKVWLAVMVGFAGVMVMLQPGSGLFEPAALLSLLSAAMYAGSMLMARRLGTTQAASVMSFHQNAIFLLGALLTAVVLHQLGIVSAVHPSLSFLVRPWVAPTLLDGGLMAVCGVVAAVGTLFLTSAYRMARASIVTPFEYTGMLWAPTWGYLFFHEVPRITTVFGGAIVVIAGLVALRAAQRG
ncbi:DMT family transporter [Rhodoferax sp.]|uniref:DMT family transporter n=1 Tax=Rhodoferax sp. TaxID=50421 RepID=UPI00374D3B29